MSEEMQQEAFWSETWRRHLEKYLASPPRLGHWLEVNFPRALGLSVLEIAGGSCRDSRRLADAGYQAMGTDFDVNTLDYLHQRFPDSPLVLRREDAFAMDLADRSVDISFSNGFWCVFNDDADIIRQLREQVRVTRRYVIIGAHNPENPRLVADCAERAKTDPLFDFRFFGRDEVVALVRASGVPFKSLTLRKFGGSADILYSDRLKGVPNPLRAAAPRLAPRLYDLTPWSRCERSLCVLEL